MLDEKTELDEDIAAEMQMVNDLRNFLNRDREGKSWLDINEDGVVDTKYISRN